MPVHTTYPGVYIEEVPSAVRTIVGVSTSVTAFIGYTSAGPTDQALQLFNYGDYERMFGGLDLNSPVSYAVQQFFQNGGLEAWVVRVADGAAAASVTLLHTPGGTPVLTATARSQGVWANGMELLVDYDASNPLDQFNLTVTRLGSQNGAPVVTATETFRNLTMNDAAVNDAVATVEANSALIRLGRVPGSTSSEHGVARSGIIDTATFSGPLLTNDLRRLGLSVDGGPRIEIELAARPETDGVAALEAIAADIVAKAALQNAHVTAAALDAPSGALRRLVIQSSTTGASSSVRFSNAASRSAAALLHLGLANGGRETDGSAILRPAPSGVVGDDLSAVDLTTLTGDRRVRVAIDRFTGTDVAPFNVALWTAAAGPPGSLEELRGRVEEGLRNAAMDNSAAAPELGGVRVLLVDNHLQVVASGDAGALLTFTNATAPADTTATSALRLAAPTVQNVARYALGIGAARGAQQGAVPGRDGNPLAPAAPTTRTLLMGSEAAKTGMFALEDVDLFNILCVPGQADRSVLAAAMSYCERRRAFFVVDVPGTVRTLTQARMWITDLTAKSANAAAYFPWVTLPDPLSDYRPRQFPPSGMIAGLYSRTDGTRGVWKAPAGTEATLRGPQGTDYKLTDMENGVLNPLGLNSIRALPVYGIVSWGARTLVGADAIASPWKYIPVRRLALFIEESLFRGTQWVVFEPNDNPLWSQIRLNVGAFMHNLFRQGAFQGVKPADAYLVKCDSETTTQNDIDLGIVNILVGFRPLKPAEFVILRISQLAGQVEA